MTESSAPQGSQSGVSSLSGPRVEPETWHSLRALSSGITGALGIALIGSSHGNGLHVFFGILFLVAVVAGAVITRFWFQYDQLSWWEKTVASVGYLPGALFGIIALWILKTIGVIAEIFV